MTLFEVLQLIADVCRFLATHGHATRAHARARARAQHGGDPRGRLFYHEGRRGAPTDRVGDRNRDRDIEMNYEVDKLTAV